MREASAEQGLVILVEPLEQSGAREVVRRFFVAVQSESTAELEAVLSSEAVLHAGPGATTQPAVKVWASRFERLDYQELDARRVFREHELELYEPRELAAMTPPRHFVLAPRGSELLAVAHVHEPRVVGAPRRFGARIEFVVERTPEGYRIREVFEDFSLK